MKKLKCRSLALADRDLEKIDVIRQAEEVKSRSEVVRRLVDQKYEAVKNESKK